MARDSARCWLKIAFQWSLSLETFFFLLIFFFFFFLLFAVLKLLFSCSEMSDSLLLHGLQHARLPCPSPTPRTHVYRVGDAIQPSCPLLSSSPQSFPALVSFMSQFFASGGQSVGASASARILRLWEFKWCIKPELGRCPGCIPDWDEASHWVLDCQIP